MSTPPLFVVFVPGITGTSLRKSGNIQDVWWEQVGENVAFHGGDDVVHLLTQSGLEPGQPLQSAGTVEIYGTLLDYFQKTLGYQYVVASGGDVNLPLSGNVLVGFAYDWRLSNADSAKQLDSLLTVIADAAPSAPIWLLAHSMGGLVSRYVLESGAFSKSSYKVSGLITAATPHLGAPFALSAITGQANQSDLLNPQIIETLVDEPKFVSAFQLLPPSETSFVFGPGGAAESIYDTSSPVYQLLVAAAPNGFGAPAASFTAATGFQSKLNYTGAIPYYVAYGSGRPTVESFNYDPTQPTIVAQLAPQVNTSQGGGDGTVPEWSTNLPNATASFNAGPVTHGGIVTDAATLQQINSWITGG